MSQFRSELQHSPSSATTPDCRFCGKSGALCTEKVSECNRMSGKSVTCPATSCQARSFDIILLLVAIVVVQSRSFVLSPKRPSFFALAHDAGLARRLRGCCLVADRVSTCVAQACSRQELCWRPGTPLAWEEAASAEARQLLWLSW